MISRNSALPSDFHYQFVMVDKQRVIPLIVATALFMENMDSTVIATSLPAIAADIGTSPLTLKLAITSYLLSLAVFIPASGWTADRFGARMVFAIAVGVFMVGSVGCALSTSVNDFVFARILQGMGGAMMTPVGRLVLLRSVDKSALVNAMAWVTVPALIGPVIGPPLGGFITTYASWHWIFLINIPIGLLGIFMALRFIDPIKSEEREPFDLYGMVLAGLGLAGIAFGLSVAGLNLLPWSTIAALVVGGSISMTLYVIHARRTGSPVLDFSLLRLPTLRAAILGGFIFRLGIGALPFLLPLLMQIRLRPVAVQVRSRHVWLFARRHGHEGAGRTHHPRVRLPQADDGERTRQRGFPRRLCAVHGDDAAAHHHDHPGDRRLLPLAGIHRDQHGGLCRSRDCADEPRHHARQRQPAARGLGRRRRGCRLGGDHDVAQPCQRAQRHRVCAGLRRDRPDLGCVELVLLADAR
ncbi:MFS family permease [Bradyrhizobium sp. LB7.2]